MSTKWMRIASVAMYVSLVGVVPLSVIAQDAQAPAPQQDGTQQQGPGDGRGPGHGGPGYGGPGRGGPGGGERQMEHMTRELNLTADQQTQVRAIEMDARQQAMAMRQDTATPEDQKREKMMSLRTASQAKVRAVLTDDQKVKFDAMEARMHERMEHRGGPGQGAGPNGPGSTPSPQQ